MKCELAALDEGDTLEEMQDVLSDIPTELEDLYLRTLHRSRRTSTRVLTNNKFEAYVMFQIAITAAAQSSV